MKILSILGSPKTKGKTSQVLTAVEEKLKLKGHTVNRIHLKEIQINPCLGCLACTQSTNSRECVQKDSIQELFDEMVSSDTILYAAPLYGWGVNSAMKALFDRHMPLVKGAFTSEHFSFLENKRVSLLMTCLGPDEKPNTDLVKEFFSRFGSYLKAKEAHTNVVPFSMSPTFAERAETTADKIADELGQ